MKIKLTRRMLRYAPRFHKNFPQRNSPKIIFTIFFFFFLILKIFRENFCFIFFGAYGLLRPIWSLPAKIWGV
jgi:hypothetical protein